MSTEVVSFIHQVGVVATLNRQDPVDSNKAPKSLE